MIVYGQDCKRNLNIGGFKKVGLFLYIIHTTPYRQSVFY